MKNKNKKENTLQSCLVKKDLNSWKQSGDKPLSSPVKDLVLNIIAFFFSSKTLFQY